MGYKRVILKPDQEPSIVAFCDAVKNGWHGEVVPEASPKGESKSNGEVKRAVPICARTCEISQRLPGATSLESPWKLEVRGWLGWPSIVPIFSYSSTKMNHMMVTQTYMRLKGKPWRVEMPSFGECVDYRKRTRHKLEARWSRGVFVGHSSENN